MMHEKVNKQVRFHEHHSVPGRSTAIQCLTSRMSNHSTLVRRCSSLERPLTQCAVWSSALKKCSLCLRKEFDTRLIEDRCYHSTWSSANAIASIACISGSGFQVSYYETAFRLERFHMLTFGHDAVEDALIVHVESETPMFVEKAISHRYCSFAKGWRDCGCSFDASSLDHAVHRIKMPAMLVNYCWTSLYR